MKRLTTRNGFMDFTSECTIEDVKRKLKEYEDAEETGTLVRLPCKVGGTVYTNFCMQGSYLRKKDRPYQCKVVYIGVNYTGSGQVNVQYSNGYMWQFDFSDFGKRVFLTREEAEKALKK